MNFTIYNLIAMTRDDGLLQFVPDSKTIQDILKDGGSISKYLRSFAKDDEKEYDRILNNYIMSCAGYSCATYILGIGDRHLENLMITKDGKLFHIDFGFIFGKEPNNFKERLSSKIRISKSMVEPMGGIGGEKYTKFEKKFVESFKILRNK
jgi:phosphatidylinositol 3-kinase